MAYDGHIRTSNPGATSVDYDRVKRNGFHDSGILVIDVNDPNLTWDQRELLNQIGEKFYGKRKQKA
jgi:hypothetical protein